MALPVGQTTIRAKPSPFGPTSTVAELGIGAEHDGNASGEPCLLFALPTSHG